MYAYMLCMLQAISAEAAAALDAMRRWRAGAEGLSEGWGERSEPSNLFGFGRYGAQSE
jgi:hypothetical protein